MAESKFCPQCGTALTPGSHFCDQCGKEIKSVNNAVASSTEIVANSRENQPIIPTSKAEVHVSKIGEADFRSVGEAVTNSRPGTRIVVHSGMYDEVVVIDKPLAIAGQGQIESVTIRGVLVEEEQVSFSGLTFGTVASDKGDLFLYSCAFTGKRMPDQGGIQIGQLHFEDNSGLLLLGRATAVIQECKIEGCPVRVYDNAGVTLEDCHISDCKTTGVLISSPVSCHLKRCTIISDGTDGDGVVIQSGSMEYCNVSGSKRYGISVGSGNVKITH